jgi:hypothetical protein
MSGYLFHSSHLHPTHISLWILVFAVIFPFNRLRSLCSFSVFIIFLELVVRSAMGWRKGEQQVSYLFILLGVCRVCCKA